MGITLRQIRYFVATAEIGQISQAAIQLNISQSAVTSAIQALEGSINTPLFIRAPKGVTLTDAGRHLLNHAYVIMRSLDDALSIPQADPLAQGSLNIAASYTVMGYFFPFHLQRFSQWYPNLRLQPFEAERRDIEQGLLERRFDMAVVLTANLTHQDIVSETLFNSARRLWLPAQHPLLQHESLSLRDITEHPFIMLTVDEADHSAMRYWTQSGLRPNVRLRTSSVESVRSMVANGQGISILSDLVYRPWSLEGRRIDTRPVREQVHPMSVGLAWRKDVEFTTEMQAFRDYFRSAFLTPQLQTLRR